MISRQLLNHLVYPVRIPTPFAVGDVYCYLVKDEKTVLVDCAHRADDSLIRLKAALKEHGLAISDLDEIWLTHGHPDHFGQAAVLADASGADIFGHAKERANFEGNSDGSLYKDFFREQHIPENQILFMVEQLDWLQQFQEPVCPEWVDTGEVLTSGSLSFTVRHTPGHAPGHLTFYSAEGIVFAGDVLLEHVSTNALINFDPDTGARNRSLLQYRESLKWLRELDGMVLPGHGSYITQIRETADRHLNEHQNRYRKIRRLLAAAGEGYTLYELALRIFPDAMKKGAVFLVLSEVLGYLDWGVEEGTIERVRRNSGIRYRSSH